MRPRAEQKRQERQGRQWVYDPQPHGSARWADGPYLAQRGYGPRGHHLLGYLPAELRGGGVLPVTYSGDRHQLIVAPTRAGKGVSGSILRLLDHHGSAVVIDLKDGELALVTARYRARVLGQRIILIDPFDVVASRLGLSPSRLNPMEGLDPGSDTAFDEALLIGEAVVIPESAGENHWSGEAEALVAGLILREAELGGTLKDVRAALNRDADGFKAYVEGMAASRFEKVRAAAGRILNKADRELSGVISTAQRNTHFLESDRLAASLSGSDFELSTIGRDTSIYIVLPARRIRSARRWLRLLIATLINAVTALPTKPALPVMVLLEEMATLERMSIIEQSFALMAGYGLQLVGVVQDFTQLRDLYRDRWETFPANAACVQCFGTNDYFTARYLSQLAGQTSTERLSYETASVRSSLLGDPAYRGPGDAIEGRALITPDELMGLHPAVQFIKLAAARPFIGYRSAYFLDSRYRDRRGRPLFGPHPHHAGRALPRPIAFTRPGLDVGAALAAHLRVG